VNGDETSGKDIAVTACDETDGRAHARQLPDPPRFAVSKAKGGLAGIESDEGSDPMGR